MHFFALEAAHAAEGRVQPCLRHPSRPRPGLSTRETLGLKRGLGAPNGVWTEYDLPGGGCLALFDHPVAGRQASIGPAVASPSRWIDLDATITKLQGAGVKFNGDIVKGPNCRMMNIEDSEATDQSSTS